ncbi:site-specific DNA-methyltransferase [Gulosibacter massiliensis]|uniref:site-specific DNA-methyltransferase n=1 Tax=Gulosibacter massiliensis TaxID=2479839 RepID=UPI000F637C91|nr:DNA methyltransferase [Gulosibacter massiliensis]
MSRLTDLLRQLRSADPQLGADLEKEITALTKRRSFGLVFERHQPEAVELPGQPIRRGSKVRVLPPRGEIAKRNSRLWRVESFTFDETGAQLAQLVENVTDEPERQTASLDDLVVVAEFDDKIFPGLVETGRVEHGGDKPFHTVINAENYHALEMLTYTHRGKVDAIYIDPPYNTGARDWKYNNDYVEGDDDYRHSKWLAFMERRLVIARELLNPEDSVLIATIDEKEVLRLGLLLDQLFPESDKQLVTIVTNHAGSIRSGRFTRVEEYAFVLFLGAAVAGNWSRNMLSSDRVEGKSKRQDPTVWFSATRTGGAAALRANRQSPVLFYPVHRERETGRFHSVGEPIPRGVDRSTHQPPEGTDAIWPLASDGSEQTWQVSGPKLAEYFSTGHARFGTVNRATGLPTVMYLRQGTIEKLQRGEYREAGRADDGSIIFDFGDVAIDRHPPTSVWYQQGHFARDYGTQLLSRVLGGRPFPFPKSLYAVEDTLRFFVKDKPNAVVLDFFSGSGTTAHAVMRLNKQDGGSRQCISVTNNEVGADEQKGLRQQGFRPGDPEWEQWGICDYITKPRIRAAITGRTPDGEPIKGDYKFTDESPMADGFEENAAFLTLTYESPLSVRHNRAFERIAPMLWMRAGSTGRIINDLDDRGWDVSEVYAVLENIDNAEAFFSAMRDAEDVRTVFVITDDDAAFQMVCRELPSELDMVRLYESYLQNFEINQGRAI